jgi:hypothetical protein
VSDAALPPRLQIEPVDCQPCARAGEWQASWRIRNAADEAINLLETWLPHGRFRWEPRKLEPPIQLGPGAELVLDQPVRCQEAAGTVVENTFLFLKVTWRGRPWRVLARHRIEWNRAGPRPVCELITTQPVGFSASSSSDRA